MKTVLITGGSGGVATALAALLRDNGWRIVRVGRRMSAEPASDSVTAIEADVSTEAGALHAIESASDALGTPPFALAHCAGSSFIGSIERTSELDYRSVMAANLDSAFFTSKAWVASLARKGLPGSAVLFSSVVAARGVANHAAIAAAKAGVESLVRSLAADYSAKGIRFNAIAPGLMRTPMTTRMLATERSVQQAAAQYPLGRHGEAADAAALAGFLLSDDAAWITGQVIGVDGGFSAVRPLVRVTPPSNG
ncbi:MAG: SDR family oxidoreductase [Dokdonella sp.]|uniref:SDR family NAD(P)-dependent oxidoreductase n=1 Tax=Dokdonella sp. TaxID=2291710 RepID=UPI0032638A09